MTLLENFKNTVLTSLKDLKYPVNWAELPVNFSFLETKNNHLGDVASNLAIVLSSKLDQNPKELQKEILKKLESSPKLKEIIEKIELAPNGFLNFFFKEEFLAKELGRISQLEKIATKFTEEKILVEHSSPNLFKPFHVGHLMNNIIGEAIVKMMQATESDLRVVAFPSDVSLGIAKAIFILKSKTEWSFSDENIIQELGQAYTDGVNFYEEHPESHERIKEIAKYLFEKNEASEAYRLFQQAREINIAYFEKALGELGTKLDHIIYESEAGIKGLEIIKGDLNKVLAEQVFQVGEGGAIFYDTHKKKNKQSNETIKSIFINSEGHPTYEAKDLGLLALKYQYFPFQKSLFVTDNEQVPHFEVVLSAAEKLDGDLKIAAERSQHIPHGRLALAGERMSSRLGNVLAIEEVLEKLYKKTQEKMSEKTAKLSEQEKKEVVRKVSLSALKITILKSKPGLNINFDFEQSLAFEGATGPYLLYTYARANSLLDKAQSYKVGEIKITEANRNLILKLLQVEDILKAGIENLAPQTIVKYLFELAQEFNTFYGAVKILSEVEEVTEANLALVQKFMQIFKFSLNTLGIEEVEKM